LDNNQNNANLRDLSNCIRFLSMDAVQKAKSGHPGMPMGMSDIATILFKSHLKFDPKNPDWIDRDRFIVSNGHGSMLLYSCLYLLGYSSITIENIKNFRQLNHPTAGHPEFGTLPGIETTTGPLSQGLSNAVGLAIAEKKLSAKFSSEVIDHFTYVFAGDGCLMEGLSHEACSLAGHLKLNKLIMFFDDNSISIDGSTNLSTSDDIKKRFESYNWNYLKIDGHNFEEIDNAIIEAKKSLLPTIIACKTIIGYGSPNKSGKASSHGSPLGEDEIELIRKELKWENKAFEIPNNLLQIWRDFHIRNIETRDDWNKKNIEFFKSDDFNNYFSNNENKNLKNDIIKFKNEHFVEKTVCATRKASELSLNLISSHLPNLIGGSADLTGSNNTKAKEMRIINSEDFTGNYIHYGIREHAMAGIMNGIALHGGLKPYGGTFLVFSDYCRPSIRLSALMNIPVIFVMTHDSIGLGEDGPTHQPVEHLAALRAIPNLIVIRPSDVIETIEAWQTAINNTGPTVLVLTRQNLPINQTVNRNENLVKKGAYVLLDYENYDATILSSGSEVEIACSASKKLKKNDNICARVISIPSFELFEKNDLNYKKEIIGNKPVFGIEAGIINGWEKYLNTENFIGMTTFGESGPYKELYNHFNITDENLIEKISKTL
jgi:transketolase